MFELIAFVIRMVCKVVNLVSLWHLRIALELIRVNKYNPKLMAVRAANMDMILVLGMEDVARCSQLCLKRGIVKCSTQEYFQDHCHS